MNTLNRATQQVENDLVKSASNGNLNAFNELVLNHQDTIYNHAYAILGDHASAEDVTQDTFIKAFEKLNGFRGGTFRSWLMTIAANSAYDILRRAKRHPTQPLFPEDENGNELESARWLVDESASIQDIVEQEEFSRTITKLLGELPYVYRTILTMIDIHGYDYAETAHTLNIPIGTVKSRLARARLQMSKKLRDVKNTPLCLYSIA